MNEYELEVFWQTPDYAQLRLRDGSGGPVRTRDLDRAAIDALIQDVDRSYEQHSAAQRVFDAQQLRQLGEKLLAFLDGDERWFTSAMSDPRGVTVRIQVEQERLRHLPWELTALDGVYLTVRANAVVLPVRVCRPQAIQTGTPPGNRPLRVLFMASSPEDVEPVLNYEGEEAAILAATARTGTDLVVEESGTLEGLRFTAQSYGAGYFDVLHLSGHADIRDGTPVFQLENEFGALASATAHQIAGAMDGHWPRLVFVSGCLTGGASAGGTAASMSESLVAAGASIVLGWALPVGDAAASEFAAHLYRELAAGERLDQALVRARRELFAQQDPNWHLLRVYADASPLTAMVTPLSTPGRERIRRRQAAEVFLDPLTQLSRVASRAEFVGRRRVIQRCLHTVKQPLGQPGSAQALVLQGLGGLGKSTLASRLLERMPTHQRVVWYGRVDLTRLRSELLSQIEFPTPQDYDDATALLADDDRDLAVRLRFLFAGPLATTPCLFVFDDFEQGNLEERGGGHVLSPQMAQILPALLNAIDATNSSSRVIITSRYQFPTPARTQITVESLETLTRVEQTKKIANLTNLRAGSPVAAAVRDRAIEAAAGNPRLLEWLDKVVDDAELDVDALISAIEGEAARFREAIFAERLLATQPEDLRIMLARVNVIELPAPAVTVHAVHDHPDVDAHIARAVQLGLLEAGTDPQTGQARYHVSNVLRPLLRPLLTDDDYAAACGAAARSLYAAWGLSQAKPAPGEPDRS